MRRQVRIITITAQFTVTISNTSADVLQPSGLINFDKWYKVAWVVREIRKFQVTKYPFRVVPEVIHTLTQLPVLPENEIYSLSLKCEERAKV